MEYVSALVKRWLEKARSEHDPSSVRKAYYSLKSACSSSEMVAGPPAPSELFILVCEEAIRLELWEMAQHCVDDFHSQMTCNKMLEARGLYCEGIVRAHFISVDLTWPVIIEERLYCAKDIIRGITIAIEEWPKEAWAVVHGIEKLWEVIAPLYQFGHFKSILEIVSFIVTLHEKLMIGGGKTYIHWVARLAVCLRGAGRIQESILQLNSAMDSAIQINSERLQVQLIRMLTVFMAEGGSAPGGTKSKQETAKNFLYQAVQTSQLFLIGQTDVQSAKADLISVYERMLSAIYGGERDAASSVGSGTGGKIKGKAKNPLHELGSDTEVLVEVLSDVVLCLTLSNEAARCEETIFKLRASSNSRARTFGSYSKTILTAYESGVMEVIDSPDSSYLTSSVAETLNRCIQEVESTMDGARMIQDEAERMYSLQVGCSLLWNFCLPLLQADTHSSVQHVLNRIVKEMDGCPLSQPSFQVQVEYESSLAEFNEDNISLAVRRIQRALSRNYSVTLADGSLYFPMNYSLLWLLRRCDIRVGVENSDSSIMQEEVMHHLSQAEHATTATKCITAIKNAFNKLPLLTPEEEVESLHPVVPMGKEFKEQNSSKKQKMSVVYVHRPPPLSLARLYFQLLHECISNLSPPLVSIAETIAQALSSMEIGHDVKYADFIFMKANASLLLAKVLFLDYTTGNPTEDKAAIATRLFQAFKETCNAESVLQELGQKSAWMTINSCLLYLDFKAPIFSSGNFSGVSQELCDMYNFFIALPIDFDREKKLTVDLSLMYILSLLDDYIRGRGGLAVQPTSYDQFVDMALSFSPKVSEVKGDALASSLNRAFEVCAEVMRRVVLPSDKAHIYRLYAAICRLLNSKVDVVLHYPQEQLLFLFGRIAGPLSKEERRTLVKGEAWELLQKDPSVQLCGQLAVHAMDLGEEHMVLDICRVADKLYKDGKLGWGTMYVPLAVPHEKDKPSRQEKKEAFSLPVANVNAVFPKPHHLDWFWYAKLLWYQAHVFSHRCDGINDRSRESLSLQVLSLCANSATAASHGPPPSRHPLIVKAIDLFYQTVCRLWRSGKRGKQLFPSLKMILSHPILFHLQLEGSEKAGGETQLASLYEMINSLGHVLLRSCEIEGLFLQGMSALSAVFSILPKKLLSSFTVEEVRYRCQMDLPVQQILHDVKAEDVETASLVWMTYAQNTSDKIKSVEAWKYGANVLTGYSFAKANCLLEMAQHVCVHGLLPIHEVRLLLVSALDLLEGFDRAVNESCVNAAAALQGLLDERAKTYPTRLISTLTGRSLIIPAFTSETPSAHVAVLQKNLIPVTLKDLMLAIRIVFLLFSIAPFDCEKKGEKDVISKKECVLLLLHYVDCLWRVAASVVAKKLHEGAAGTARVPPLTLPTTLGGWFGFFFDDEHVLLLKEGAPAEFKHNSEGLQGILLSVADYLFEEHLEHYAFMVYSWIVFAAGWRYGCDDIRYVVVKQTSYLALKMAAAQCGCGLQMNLYNFPSLTPRQLAALDSQLQEITIAPSSSPMPVVFSAHAGSLQDVLLRRSQLLATSGNISESLFLLPQIQRRAALLKDWDTYAGCIIIKQNDLIMRNKASTALKEMEEEAVTVVESLSPYSWLKWEQQKVWLLINLGRGKELFDAQKQFIATLQTLPHKLEANTVAFYICELIMPVIVEKYGVFTIDALTKEMVSRSMYSELENKFFKELLDELCAKLDETGSIFTRMAVRKCRLKLSFMRIKKCAISDVMELLEDLKKEREVFDELFTSIGLATAEVCTALSLATTESPLRPSLNTLESYLLFFRGENIIARMRVARIVLAAYRSLSMEELGIPTTEGRADLEKHVMDFIRDPTKNRGAGANLEEQRFREAKWGRLMDDLDWETINALEYYGIPKDLFGDISAFDCRATLYQAAEVAGAALSPAYFVASRSIVQVELLALIENELPLEGSALSLEARVEALLNFKWSQCPIHPVAKVVTGKKGGAEKALKKSKDALGDWTARLIPVELTESNAAVLHRLFQVIKEASDTFNFARLYTFYMILGDFYTIWKRPQAAATAIEFAQTARLVGYLSEVCFLLMEDTEEARAWRCLRDFTSRQLFLWHSSSFNELRRKVMQLSPILSYMDLPSKWPEDPETNMFCSLPETVTLSIVQVVQYPQYFIVVLRHPDGTADCRRKRISLDRVKELGEEYDRIVEVKRQAILKECRNGVTRQDAFVTVADLQDYLNALRSELRYLWEDFEESLENLAPRCSLYLCLDPVLQPLPLDHLPVFSSFLTVQREISILEVKRKLDCKLTKSLTVLNVVDPFGDSPTSVEPYMSEKKSSKETHVLTATDKAFPFSMEYLMWLLEQPTYQAVLFHLSGSLTSILSPVAVASLKWNHIVAITIAADAVNEASMRREQKNELTKDSKAHFYDKKWLLPLLLLLRGVRYVAVNSFPTTIAANDALCRRITSVLGSGRGIYEATSGSTTTVKGAKDSKKVEPSRRDLMMFFGVPCASSKGGK